MPRVLLKDIFVEIRRSLGRFCSILAIVALGVAFFAGIKASAPDMEYSADQYFDQYNLQDLQIFSTLGLDDQDIKEIEKIPGVEDVQPLYTQDVLTYKGSSELVFKLFSLPEKQTVNIVRLVEGRMPEKESECLIEAPSVSNSLFEGFKIGDTIKLKSGTSTPLDDTLNIEEFKVVGTCYTPFYLSYEKGSSSIGSGEVNSFLFVPQSAVKAGYYTEVDATVNGAKALNTYDKDDYFDLVDPVKTGVENIGDERIAAKIQEQQDKVDEARQKLEKEIAKGQKKIDNSQKKVDEGLKEIKSSEKALASAKSQLDTGWNAYYSNLSQIEKNLPAVAQGIAQIQTSLKNKPVYQSQLEQVKAGLSSIDEKRSELEASRAKIQEGLGQIQALNEQIENTKAALENEELEPLEKLKLEGALAQMESAASQLPDAGTLNSQLSEADQGLAQLEQKRSELQENQTQLESGLAQLAQAENQLASLQATYNQLTAGKDQLNQSYQTLASSQAEYESGLSKLDEAKSQVSEAQDKVKEGQKKLDEEKQKGLDEIAKAQQKVDELEGKWIVLDRNSHYSYRDYGACAERMDGIASVFPVFFFLVAALVCMTTMTRMVDEERTEIGTLKALGYSKLQIASKYLIYALLASILGSIIGCIAGMIIFPYIIFYAWNTMYNIETIRYQFQPGLMVMASLSVTGVVLIATIYSIYKELMEVPSQLMRPKAGKAGKKIFLEKLPWLWNRVSFLHKVTLRNIFLYKRRFFMTVIGIAGCSALLVSGFGINDSISDIVNLQFKQIYHYDAIMNYDVKKADENILKQIEQTPGVQEIFEEQTLNATFDADGKDMTGTIHVISNPEKFKDFTTLKSIQDGSEYSVKGKGAWINEKLAQKMNLKTGDTIEMKINDETPVQAKVAGIFENYVNHQVYITSAQLKDWHINPDDLNESVLIKSEDTSDAFEKKLGNSLMSLDGAKSVTFYSSVQENFLNMIGSIKMVVVVLVVSAAALAFVVLYNLSNVNISERMREIATIKVLGFTEKEVNAYVNRESLLLAVIGCVVGLFAGVYLHELIMSLAELDDVMFGRTISLQSYILSFVLTVCFALVINWIMKFKLRKIEMVESLKAVE